MSCPAAVWSSTSGIRSGMEDATRRVVVLFAPTAGRLWGGDGSANKARDITLQVRMILEGTARSALASLHVGANLSFRDVVGSHLLNRMSRVEPRHLPKSSSVDREAQLTELGVGRC